LIGSKRNKSDGCTIIGSQEASANGEVFNDFVISQMDTGIGKRHMVIKYNLDNKQYYLRDLGDGSGTFVRLDIPLVGLKHFHCRLDPETWLYHILWWLSHGGLIFLRSAARLNWKARVENIIEVLGWTKDGLDLHFLWVLGLHPNWKNDKLRYQIWWQFSLQIAVLHLVRRGKLGPEGRRRNKIEH